MKLLRRRQLVDKRLPSAYNTKAHGYNGCSRKKRRRLRFAQAKVWVARRVGFAERRTTHNININELLTSLRDKGVSLLVHRLVKELGLRYSFARVTRKKVRFQVPSGPAFVEDGPKLKTTQAVDFMNKKETLFGNSNALRK